MALAEPPDAVRRVAFLGTPDTAVPSLEALVAAGFEVAHVVTRADKRRGRRSAPEPSPVKTAAQRIGLPVNARLDDVVASGVDLGVVVAFGRLVPTGVLERVPMVNVHFSLLPRWRGAAPVERAILAGDTETGVCLMRLEEGLDTGGLYRVEATEIGPDETAGDLSARLARMGARMVVDALGRGLGVPIPQVGEVTYAEKLTSDDRRLDWSGLEAEQLHRRVRIGDAWTTVDGARLKIHRAELVPQVSVAPGAVEGAVVGASEGGLELVEVQPAGKSSMDARSWLNGFRGRPPRLGT